MLTPNVFRGRVSSLFALLMGGTTPIGAILLGGIAEVWGIRAGLSVFGTLTRAITTSRPSGSWPAPRSSSPA